MSEEQTIWKVRLVKEGEIGAKYLTVMSSNLCGALDKAKVWAENNFSGSDVDSIIKDDMILI